MSGMTHITDLPSELLLDIFERLRSTSSTGTMTAFLLCCRAWHDISASVLYTHVAVDSKLNSNSALSLFIRQRTYLGLVQSLTLRIHQSHLMGFSIKLPKAYDRSEGLNAILPSMSNLKTFSLVLEEQVGKDYAIPSDITAKLLKSLPETVINLELDSYGLDDIGVSGIHLCQEIGALIPRLQFLRLRISRLCPALLAPLRSTTVSTPRNSAQIDFNARTTSPLRIAVIQLDMKPDIRGNPRSCLCGTALQMKRDPRLVFPPHFANGVH
ncbi:hypothetical protein AOQ84DRAFT_381306 [Glonium stellatum]|uniref:F-box domain-containing protein n=1 Tax=Glonium stellatum TaxID=574774 RepID=A0A8E2JND6_9PEZI|nr:hypothetical protein AOQ84DRAFT_381306 [Glonium stellatum]